MAKFVVGSWLHHRKTNEDGKVKAVEESNGRTVYAVSIPRDTTYTSWVLGADSAHWYEEDVEQSTRKILPPD